MDFGTLLREKRKQKSISLRQLSELVNLGYSYLCDIENGKKPAPNDKSVLLLAKVLNLSYNEQIEFYESAALSKNKYDTNFHIPVDIGEYIISNEEVKSEIRNKKGKT